jgi:hypothetical protein
MPTKISEETLRAFDELRRAVGGDDAILMISTCTDEEKEKPSQHPNCNCNDTCDPCCEGYHEACEGVFIRDNEQYVCHCCNCTCWEIFE